MQNKTILIAGATGMVGKALVPFLIEKGFSVTVISRNNKSAKAVFGNKVQSISWSQLLNEDLVKELKCDSLINLAGANIGAKRWTEKYKQLILESRVNSVLQLEELVNKLSVKPKVWVQASAIGYYGQGEGRQKGFLASVVKQWEEAFNKVGIPKLRKVILRFGVVLAQSEGMLYEMKRAFNMGVAACPGNGKQRLTWIHIDDLIQIIYLSICNEEWVGEINAVAPNPVSMWDFTKALKAKTRAVISVKVPSYIFQLALGKEKANELILADQQVKPEKLHEYNFQYRFKNIKDALR